MCTWKLGNLDRSCLVWTPLQAPTSTPKLAKKKTKVLLKQKKKEELEICYTTYGRKMYVNFSDDSRDEDYHDEAVDDDK